MQTFLTDTHEYGYGLRYLDQKRLVKQLLETRQIMAALAGTTRGWVNHPATRMWAGKEGLLWDYGWHNALELEKRGYKWRNNYEEMSESYDDIAAVQDTGGQWDRDDFSKVIYTHRGRLYEKDPEYYADWVIYSDFHRYVCCDRCNYYWPSHIWEEG